MKRFKNISNLSDVNPGDKANALSPKSVYSQAGRPRRLPPSGRTRPTAPSSPPPQPSVPFVGIKLPDDFEDRIRDAIKIMRGLPQIDELKSGAISAILSAAGFAMKGLPQLSFLGSEWSKIAHYVGVSQLASTITNMAKPGARALWAHVAGLDELKKIEKMQYKINVYLSQIIPGTDTLMPGTFEISKDMTLKDIAGLLVKAEGDVSDSWQVAGRFYTFADPNDVKRIATMLDRNDASNKIDSYISAALPFTAFGAPIAYTLIAINNARDQYKKSGDEVIQSNPGVYQATTPEQRKNTDDAAAEYARRQRLEHSKPRKKQN